MSAAFKTLRHLPSPSGYEKRDRQRCRERRIEREAETKSGKDRKRDVLQAADVWGLVCPTL